MALAKFDPIDHAPPNSLKPKVQWVPDDCLPPEWLPLPVADRQKAIKQESWKAAIRRILDEEEENIVTKSRRTNREAIIRAVMKLAKQDVAWAVQFIAERDEGKAGISVEVTNKRSPLESMSDGEIEAALQSARAHIPIEEGKPCSP